MIVPEYQCTVLEKRKWINLLIMRHTEKGDQLFTIAQQVQLEELITVQHLARSYPEKEKIILLMTLRFWTNQYLPSFGDFSGSTGILLTLVEGIWSHLNKRLLFISMTLFFNLKMYWQSLGNCFVGSLLSLLGCALCFDFFLPMSMGFVAWECQVHNKNPCGTRVFLPIEEAKWHSE